MNKKYNIAVVGATGAVGQMMVRILMERKFPINNLYLLASKKSDGKIIPRNVFAVYLKTPLDQSDMLNRNNNDAA